MIKKHLIPLAALSVLGMANVASAARTMNGQQDRCAPEPPATCYPDDCTRCYCLGPENYGVNAPACPVTCDGDFSIEVAGFYWNAHQDGMEYAINNRVANTTNTATLGNLTSAIQQFNNLVDAEYLNPSFKWDFGFKIGLSYCSPCDGWDVGVLWTWYKGKASSHEEAEPSDNHVLLPLWSAFASAQGSALYATDIQTQWNLDLNLIDIELGRNFWTSRYLSIRPFVGIRIALLKESYDIRHKGGSWALPALIEASAFPTQQNLNNEVELDNDYKAVGLRGGLDSTWNFGCGWALYGNLATAILYGRFDVDHHEYNRIAVSQHDKFKILEVEESFHASRAALDLALGLQWAGLVCDCKYGIMIALGWEHHMFFDINQLWRVNRIGDVLFTSGQAGERNNTGENVFHQRRGDLDTQGWTLTFKFSF